MPDMLIAGEEEKERESESLRRKCSNSHTLQQWETNKVINRRTRKSLPPLNACRLSSK
jgi:hypothetical protein